ncbi:HAD hydrolase, subfamily IA [Moorella glycerini]|uniref:(S)-2-haloacid dehalogenase 4A n=1 Tax=Neomoorella stamsii TaxID=1266720 RepID=A0A9X7P635_9FIRM|nr:MULTISPECIES: HAD family hydrolase [Moorella]PRR72736.1 (S)-2-haloacid dehalogenase 4A [Moorella stamsii]CEP68081.1 HAD hydrolase, subfamily IA [Moorella glycerini]
MYHIRAVTFDAYGTLFNIEGLHAKATELILQANSFPADPVAFHREWDKFADKLIMAGPFSKLWVVFDQALDMTFRQFGFRGRRVPNDLEIWLRMIENCQVYTAAPVVVEAVGRQFRTALISNTDNHELSIALMRHGLKFDAIVTSEDARAYKPSPVIFQQAAELLKCNPEEIIHIGDSFIADVVGAKGFGATAVWLNRKRAKLQNQPVQPDYIVECLEEVLDIIGDLVN